MNFNEIKFFEPNILFFMGMSLFLNALIAYFWHKKIYQKLNLKTYKAIQRIHLNETPRLGGFVFILCLTSLFFYSSINENIPFLKLILICLSPIIIFGLKEDIFHNVDPAVRLISLLFAGWLFRVNFTGPLPHLNDVPIINKLILLNGGVSFFYILAMVAISNGMNLIDGVNGLCSALALSVLSSLLYLSYKTSDVVMVSVILNVILILIPFVFINYPYGKIFLGDLGSYSLGFILSVLTIAIFGRHPEISPWAAALILIYPVTEVSFTIIRRILKGTSIYSPDKKHLHLKLFLFYRPQGIIANSLVTPSLSILWLYPLITIPWVYSKPFLIFCAIILFIMIYCFLYFLIPSTSKRYVSSKNDNQS